MKKESKGEIAKSSRIIFNPTGKIIRDPVGPENVATARSGIYAHFCYDWDELLIDETDPEFEACTCGKSNPKT